MPMTIRSLGGGKSIVRSSEDTIWSRRRNLKGIVWKVGVKVAVPYSFKDKRTNVIYGFAYELWMLIARNLNVTSELIEFDDYGKSDDDKTWNGVVGALQENSIDVSMSPMGHSFGR